MNLAFSTYKIHRVLYFMLLLVTVLDPGNQIFRMKELFFVLTFAIGLFGFLKFTNLYIIVFSCFFSLLYPLIWLFFGYLFDYQFSAEYGVMYLKSFAFFMLLNVSLDTRIDFPRLFAISTLLVIPITIFLFNFISGYEFADVVFLDYESTLIISRRAFGGFIFDPVIFYKTSPLLIFGLSYLCQENRLKYSFLNMILIILCLSTLIISGTRANMLCGFIIILVFVYVNFFSKSKIKKTVFWISLFFSSLIFLIPFLSTYVFDKSEQSNETKLNIISDYFSLWSKDIFSVFLGQGLGGGFNTSERGLVYLAEPTYFEVIRMFGLIGGFFILIFILAPLYLLIVSKDSDYYKKYYYVFVAYLLYIFIEIPSNPLLLSSTGMLVMVVIYSVSIKVYRNRNKFINNY